MPERKGQYTVMLSSRPTVLGCRRRGKKRKAKALWDVFSTPCSTTRLWVKTWEKASAFQKRLPVRSTKRAFRRPRSCLQAICSIRISPPPSGETNVPLLGQFGACSTMAQTLALAAIFVDSGAADVCSAVTSSHFCTAERQFRYPLEYGGQRPPTSQWTATAAGSAVVGMGGNGPHIESVCIGRVTDLGVTDMNNMGAAMAPAAADTLYNYFQDTATKPDDYDLILTGDLSSVGKRPSAEAAGEKKGLQARGRIQRLRPADVRP